MNRAELLLVVLVLPFLFVGQGDVKGSYVVAGVQSHISVAYGQEIVEFDTYKTELIDAINERGLTVYDQDLFSIDRSTKLYGQTVKLNITKSLPVVINDDGKHIMGRTVSSNPEKILGQNNIKFWPEDILTIELITDPVTTGGVGQLVTIKRAPVYTVVVDGKNKEVRTWEKNVKTIVEKSSTKLNPNDIVSPSLKSNVASGAVIKITRINYAEVSESESIPFKTIYQGSTSLGLGQTRATTSGITGSKKLTYKITYKNGEEVSRVLLGSTITRAKRDAKILRGATRGYTKFGWYSGYVTAFYKCNQLGLMGRYLLVTNLDNGKSIKVKIIGNGPTNGALMDMSHDSFEALGVNHEQGIIDNVMVQLVD